jgi:hypothetical protein
LVELSGTAEQSEKNRKKQLKPFVSNGFNRNSCEFSRKKAAQTRFLRGSEPHSSHTVIPRFDPLQTAKIRRYRPFLAVEPRFCGWPRP